MLVREVYFGSALFARPLAVGGLALLTAEDK